MTITSTSVKKQPIPFGRYLLLDRINIGGMAEVWRGQMYGTSGCERLVAIKRILPNIAEDEEFIRMFIDEAKISVQLTHANIAQIYDLGHIQSSYFIAMEYIASKDLRVIFERCRKMGEPAPIPLCCYVVAELCEGLDHAHRKKDSYGRDLNIVHRDVSPQNVLISYDGEVKVIDFGIAKAANKATRTQAGILKGKFGYMSPEQIRGLPLDRRSDIFAIGVCLYEVLTGERLFVGETDFSVLEKVRKAEVAPPSRYNQKIPEALERIVLRALSRDVDERYQYANDLGKDLRRFLLTAGPPFGRKEMMQYMRATFADDVERERLRLEEYSKIELPESLLQDLKAQAAARPISSRPERSGPQPIPTVTIPDGNNTPGRRQSLINLPRVAPLAPAVESIEVPIVDDDEDTKTVLAGRREETKVLPPRFDDSPEPATMPGSIAALDRLNALGRPGPAEPEVPTLGGSQGSGRQPTDPALDEPVELPTRPPFALQPEPEPAVLTDLTSEPGLAFSPPPEDFSSPPEDMAGATEPRGQFPPLISAEPTVVPIRTAASPSAPPPRRAGMGVYVGFGLLLLLLLGVIGYLLRTRQAPTAGFLYLDVPSELRARVRVNVSGEDLGNPTAWPVLRRLPVGPAAVLVTSEGYQAFTQMVEVKEGGQMYKVNAELQPLVKQAKLFVLTEPDEAEIKLGGVVVKAAGEPGPFLGQILEGTEQPLEVTLPGYQPHRQPVRAQGASMVKLTVKLEGFEHTISVSSEPPGATILVRGQGAGVTPDTVRVRYGVPALTLTKRCFEPLEVSLPLPVEPAGTVPVQGSLRKLPGCQ